MCLLYCLQTAKEASGVGSKHNHQSKAVPVHCDLDPQGTFTTNPKSLT